MKAFKDLREFIKALEADNELIRIPAKVSSELEIAEITDRISKGSLNKNKALLFENIENYEIPILINSMGSISRMQKALGVSSLDDIAQRIEKMLDLKTIQSFPSKIQKLLEIINVKNFLPINISNALCQEVFINNINEAMLDKLPILKCSPKDAAEFITLPIVFSKDPISGARNVGMYRLQKYNNNETGFHVHPHHDCFKHCESAKSLGLKKLEIAVAIGCDPAVVYSATAPLLSGIDEMIFAGFLRNKAVEMTKCKTINLEVPANAEIILEGYVDLEDLREEGEFGDHTGFYSPKDFFPTFKITAMTHRKNPVYMTTIVGKPPQEDCYMGKATERIFLPLLKLFLSEILDINMPFEGTFHNCIIIKIDKLYAGQARKVINGIWGLGQLCISKCVIVVDKNVNIHNMSELAFNVFANVDPKRDIIITEGVLDILDRASPQIGYGGKIGIDATTKFKEEGFERKWSEEIIMNEEIKKLVDSRWNEYFFDKK